VTEFKYHASMGECQTLPNSALHDIDPGLSMLNRWGLSLSKLPPLPITRLKGIYLNGIFEQGAAVGQIFHCAPNLPQSMALYSV